MLHPVRSFSVAFAYRRVKTFVKTASRLPEKLKRLRHFLSFVVSELSPTQLKVLCQAFFLRIICKANLRSAARIPVGDISERRKDNERKDNGTCDHERERIP